MDFKAELKQRTDEANEIISKYLPGEEGMQKTCLEAMNYSVLAGGKRLRPILMRETYRLFGGEGEVIEPFMAAMEMIHNYSLVHDDLPAMDNDEYRRGKKTTHAVYGEAMGILAGDALLNFAYETAAKAFDIETDEKTAKAMQILGQKAGIFGMVGGQVVDVENEGKEISEEMIDFINKNKTAALIEGSMMIGAVLAGATEQQTASMEAVAYDIGVAFQIQDDILDVTSSLEVLGKPIGSDAENEKTNYVTLRGVEGAQEMVNKHTDRAIAILNALPGDNEFLRQLLLSLAGRKY